MGQISDATESPDLTGNGRADLSEHVREKRQRRREEILHAALRAFREKGYHATTLDDIAEQLGSARPPSTTTSRTRKRSSTSATGNRWPSSSGIHREAPRSSTPAGEQLAYVIREHVRVMTDTLEGSPLAFEVTALSSARPAGRDHRRPGPLRAGAAPDHRRRRIAAGEFRHGRPQDRRVRDPRRDQLDRPLVPAGGQRCTPTSWASEFADHLVGGLACAS